jgi:hypothetical protein
MRCRQLDTVPAALIQPDPQGASAAAAEPAGSIGRKSTTRSQTNTTKRGTLIHHNTNSSTDALSAARYRTCPIQPDPQGASAAAAEPAGQARPGRKSTTRSQTNTTKRGKKIHHNTNSSPDAQQAARYRTCRIDSARPARRIGSSSRASRPGQARPEEHNPLPDKHDQARQEDPSQYQQLAGCAVGSSIPNLPH